MAAEKDKTAEVTPAGKTGKTTIRLFRDNGRYKSDVLVAVNGKAYQIKRGVDVEVPNCVAEVLRHSMEQDDKTSLMSDELEREWANKSDKLKK